jgi:hypothetical protein
MSYEFSMNRKLHIGDKIELRLLGWSGSRVTTKTYCGDTAFILDTDVASANATSMGVNLTVTNSHFPLGKICNIQLDGLRRILKGSNHSSDGASQNYTAFSDSSIGANRSSNILYRVIGKEIHTKWTVIPGPLRSEKLLPNVTIADELLILQQSPSATNVEFIQI